MAIKYDINNPIQKVKAFGCPYHGYVENGVLHLPASTTATLDPVSGKYKTPNGTVVVPVTGSPVGSSWGIQDAAKYGISGISFPVKKPGIGPVNRTAEQLSDDAINGKRWLNYAYLVNGRIYGTPIAFSSSGAWLYFDSVGTVWVIESKLQANFTATTTISGGLDYSRFGRMPKPVDTPKRNRSVSRAEAGIVGYVSNSFTFAGAQIQDITPSGGKVIMAIVNPGTSGYILNENTNYVTISIFLVEITDIPGTPVVGSNGLVTYPNADLVFTITPLKDDTQCNTSQNNLLSYSSTTIQGVDRVVDLVEHNIDTNYITARFIRPACTDIEYSKIELIEDIAVHNTYTPNSDAVSVITLSEHVSRQLKIYGFGAAPLFTYIFGRDIDTSLSNSSNGLMQVSINLNGTLYTGSSTTSAFGFGPDGALDFTIDSPLPELIWVNAPAVSGKYYTTLEFRISNGTTITRTVVFLYSDKGPFALGWSLLDVSGMLPAVNGDTVTASILEFTLDTVFGSYSPPDTVIGITKRINPPIGKPYQYQLSKSFNHAIDIVENQIVPFRETACCFL